MSAMLLSGVGGSTNWLPLVYPLVGIVMVLYAVDFIIKFVKKRRLHKENQLISEMNSMDAPGSNSDNPNS